MSGDRTGETGVSATLSEPTVAWLEERAADLGVSRGELLRGLVAAARAADEGDAAPATVADLAAVRESLADLDDELDEKIGDVRGRVVQVKREADAKAPADHDHPELLERVERAEAEADGLAQEVATLRETTSELRGGLADAEASLADLEGTVDRGFDNYEEVLEYLTEESDRLADDVEALRAAVADARAEVESLAGRVATAAGVEHLRETANRKGVRTAACEDCGGEVDVALLTSPACPHCAASFADVEPRRGFLGSHTLVVGEVPALAAGEDRPVRGERVATDGDDRRRTDGATDPGDATVDGHDGLDPFDTDD